MKEVRRQEYKYMISYKDYFMIIDMIKAMLIHDKHGDSDSYPVHSIYLDDIYFSGAMDKAFGNEIHKKFRIRYYDNYNEKKLELKKKTGNDSLKTSTPINEELYQGIIHQDVDVLEKYFDDRLIRLFTLELLKKNLEPKCNIVYKREAFRDENDNLRITFDHSLEISRFDPDIVGENIKLIHDTMLILEVKYEHFLPKAIKQIINKVSPTQTSNSKYFLGYNQIIL